jgi:hypothetical protein
LVGTISVEQRRARVGVRHHLAPSARGTDAVEVAGDLAGLHGTDPASVYLAVYARLGSVSVEEIERALYVERTLARILGMRRTMFVVPVGLMPVVQASSTQALLPGERRKFVQLIEDAGIAADGERWIKEAEEATLVALQALGEATAAELSREVPQLRERISFGTGTKWAGSLAASTRLLFLLAAEGRIVRGRPLGSWTSSQNRWIPIGAWFPEGMAELPVEVAQAELVRRWLGTFGPGTRADLKWWTGWTVRDVVRAVDTIGAVEVDIDGASGLVLPGDEDPVSEPEPWAALLPALDSTVMGWSQRDWYLGAHRPVLFDTNGNAGPTVWWCGRVVGGWAQRKDGEVAVRVLEDVGAEAATAIGAEAARLETWLGPVRVTPRFRTPLERQLIA